MGRLGGYLGVWGALEPHPMSPCAPYVTQKGPQLKRGHPRGKVGSCVRHSGWRPPRPWGAVGRCGASTGPLRPTRRPYVCVSPPQPCPFRRSTGWRSRCCRRASPCSTPSSCRPPSCASVTTNRRALRVGGWYLGGVPGGQSGIPWVGDRVPWVKDTSRGWGTGVGHDPIPVG